MTMGKLFATLVITAFGGLVLLAQTPSNIPPIIPMITSYDVSSLKYAPLEQEHIAIADLFFRALHSGHFDVVENVIEQKDAINHNPNDPKTPPGLMALLQTRIPEPKPLFKEQDQIPSLVLAHDNMVMFMWDQQAKDPKGNAYPAFRFELMRFKDGKIAEHWDVANRRENAQEWKIDWCIKAGRKDCPTP
jgi:predicted SnoaL-like aldol condensation-catalyzing enzyme